MTARQYDVDTYDSATGEDRIAILTEAELIAEYPAFGPLIEAYAKRGEVFSFQFAYGPVEGMKQVNIQARK